MNKELDKLNKAHTNKFEKWLEFVPNIRKSPTSKGASSLHMGLDLGSTFTRYREYDDTEYNIGSSHDINSDIVTVGDISTIRSTSNNLYSNLEFIVKDVTAPDMKPKKQFDEVHFVKGELAVLVPGAQLTRPSNVSKTELLSTYLNVLAALMINVVTTYRDKVLDISCFHAHLPVALPPRDFKSTKTLTEFKTNLAGHYEIELVRLGIKVNFKISESEIYTEKESNAVQYSLVNANEEMADITSIVIDGGGKSTDFSFMLEGVIVDSVGHTGDYGGAKLLANVVDAYINETGKSAPRLDAVEKSLANGILVRGSTELDISTHIKKAKKSVAQKIYNDLLAIADRANSSLDDVEQLTLHGRLFTPTETKGGEVISVADELMKLVKQVAPDIRHTVVLDTDYITEGVILSKWVNG